MDEGSRIQAKLSQLDDPTALLESIFHHAPVPVLILDGQGHPLVHNPAFFEMFGSAPPADYDVHRDEIAQAAGIAGMIRRAFAGETITLPPTWYDARELRHVNADGRRVCITPTLFPLRNAKGAVSHVGIVYKDVTAEMELRRTLEEQKRAHREVARLEAEAREMQQHSRLKSEFLANMSHELRTPLNAVLGFAELIADNVVAPGTTQYREFIGHILSSGRHLLRLINDLLDLAKIEAGRLDVRPEPVTPARLIDEVCLLMHATHNGCGISIDVSCEPGLNEAVIDPTRFRQVLFNYLSNALKFTQSDGKVEVRLRREGDDALRLEVQDNGIGIAREHLPRLFVEFQQLEPGSTKRHGGTGLGLALTRRLVEAQGGKVGVESELGRGSTFYAILPLHVQASGPLSSRPPRSTTELKPSEHAARGRARVLVVDDDFASLRLMETALHNLGFDSVGAEDATQALSLARALELDLIVLDLMLPGIDGFDLLTRLRQLPALAKTPVIVWTMKDLTSDEAALLALQTHAVLTKGGNDSSSLSEQLSTVLPKQLD